MSSMPDGATQVFAQVTRISPLDPLGTGSVPIGAGCYVTDQLIKATFTPNLETGVDLVTIGADGNIKSAFKHGDMPKYWTMGIEVSNPDPTLHGILSGGAVLTDTSTALATPGTVTATPAITGGTLAAASYSYKVTAANQYGETLASAEATGVVASGTTGSIALSLTAVTGAKYYRWYGRTAGAEQFIAQTTSPSYTDTGTPAVPAGALPTANTTAGPGNVGGQATPLYIPGNHPGVSFEFWAAAIIRGAQTTVLPYWRWVIPAVTDLHAEAREFSATLQANMYTGIARENPGWGSGPFADWQFDSSKVYQFARAGHPTVPAVGLATVPATN